MKRRPHTRRQLLDALLQARDARAAESVARAGRDLIDEETARAALEAFNRLVREGRSPVALAAGPARAAAAIATVDRGTFSQAVRERTAGILDHLQGKTRQARRRLARAAELYESGGHTVEAGDVHRILIDVLMFAGDDEAARKAARKAAACYGKAGRIDPRRRGALAMNLGNLNHRRDRHDDALAAYAEARKCYARAGQKLHVANADFNRANVLSTLDRTREARRLYERSRTTYDAARAPGLVAQADAALAALDLLEGRLDACIDRFDKVKQQQNALGDHIGLAHADMEQAEALLRLNRAPEAEQAATRAWAVFKRRRFDTETATCAGILAGAALQQGRAARAATLFRSARDIESRRGNRTAVALQETGLALSTLRSGRAREALATSRHAAREFKRQGLRSREARALTIVAEAAQACGRPRDAQTAAERALDLARRSEDGRVQLAALMRLGDIEKHRGRNAAAFRRLRAAERCVERLRRGVTSEESRLAFSLDKGEVYASLIANRLERGDRRAVRQALVFAERGKARVLAERLAECSEHLLGSSNPAANRLLSRLSRIERQLSLAESRLEGDGPTPGIRSARASQIGTLADARQDTLRRLAKQDPPGSALAGGVPENPLALIDTLREDELILEYAEADGHFHLFLVERGGVDAFPWLVPVDRVRDALDLLRFQLGKGVLGEDHAARFAPQIVSAVRAHLETLFQQLLGPVAGRLPGKRLRIVPHGLLHGLPFHALESAGVPLIERCIVSYAPSLAVMDLLARRSAASDTRPLILGIADRSAPFIEDEVRAIRRHLPGARVLRGERATSEAVHLGRSKPALMHVACHGFFSEKSRWPGALRLGDTWLTLPEVYGLEGTAELVVLSGCNTGRGTVYSGDEWVGLVRGFLQAGARSVLASLWEVHDQSAVGMMDDFYGNLARGLDVAEALALAQRKARETDALTLRWAPFMVIGDPHLRPALGKAA